MKKRLLYYFLLTCICFPLKAQNDFKFGLQTGATIATFNADISISGNIGAAIPPINEFSHIASFNVGFWFEKRFSSAFAIRWEVQRSPGGAKAFDILEEREKRYKYFYLSSPLILKIAPFQKKAKYPIQLEIGAVANYFLFDYGEEVTFGEVNQFEFSALAGVTRNIDDKWSVSVRYNRGLKPFSQYEVGGVNINWTNQSYILTFSRALFTIGPKAKVDKPQLTKEAIIQKESIKEPPVKKKLTKKQRLKQKKKEIRKRKKARKKKLRKKK